VTRDGVHEVDKNDWVCQAASQSQRIGAMDGDGHDVMRHSLDRQAWQSSLSCRHVDVDHDIVQFGCSFGGWVQLGSVWCQVGSVSVRGHDTVFAADEIGLAIHDIDGVLGRVLIAVEVGGSEITQAHA
jgi:hypothetical protein